MHAPLLLQRPPSHGVEAVAFENWQAPPKSHAPVKVRHSGGVHTDGVPAEQPPSGEQVSPTVQLLPSLHVAPVITVKAQLPPSEAWQVPIEKHCDGGAAHITAWPAQAPEPLQTSPLVQASPSVQGSFGARGAYMQVPLLGSQVPLAV
jgi:hypothetical protein